MNNATQIKRAEQFRQLHHSGKMLVLPNIWDALGALLLENLEFPAVATASASVAFANGYDDGEKIPLGELLLLLQKICNSVKVPVTADIEKGYAENDIQLQENIKLFIDAGIAGINIEDTNNKTGNIESIESQVNKIRLIKKVSVETGVPLFINARTDVYLRGEEFASDEEKLNETIKRGLAYKEAGADGFYPILLHKEDDIKAVIEKVDLPVNIITFPGIPGLKALNEMGVARVSLGPSFLKIATRAMKEAALQLKEYEGLPLITENPITSDYLKKLVNKTYRIK